MFGIRYSNEGAFPYSWYDNTFDGYTNGAHSRLDEHDYANVQNDGTWYHFEYYTMLADAPPGLEIDFRHEMLDAPDSADCTLTIIVGHEDQIFTICDYNDFVADLACNHFTFEADNCPASSALD